MVHMINVSFCNFYLSLISCELTLLKEWKLCGLKGCPDLTSIVFYLMGFGSQIKTFEQEIFKYLLVTFYLFKFLDLRRQIVWKNLFQADFWEDLQFWKLIWLKYLVQGQISLFSRCSAHSPMRHLHWLESITNLVSFWFLGFWFLFFR